MKNSLFGNAVVTTYASNTTEQRATFHTNSNGPYLIRTGESSRYERDAVTRLS